MLTLLDTNIAMRWIDLHIDEDSVIKELESYGDPQNNIDLVAPYLLVIQAKNVYLNTRTLGFDVEPHLNEDGSITLIYSKSNHFIDIEITSDLNFILRYEIGKGKDFKVIWKDLIVYSIAEVEEILRDLNNEINPSPVWSLSGISDSKPITVRKKDDSDTTRYLKNTEKESRFIIEYAL